VAKTILVIDDSETILGLVSEALRDRGHEVLCESDVFSANRHIYRRKVALLLLDVQMPSVSGNEVCRILKSKEETRAIPVVFFSDLPETELQRLAREAGADGWLAKGRGLAEVVVEVERRLA